MQVKRIDLLSAEEIVEHQKLRAMEEGVEGDFLSCIDCKFRVVEPTKVEYCTHPNLKGLLPQPVTPTINSRTNRALCGPFAVWFELREVS